MSESDETEPFENLEVAAIFAEYPPATREKLLFLRQLIFDSAKEIDGVGEIEETLKWGQPSYLTPQTGSGTTIRIGQVKDKPGLFAMFTHCQTPLVEEFRDRHSDRFSYDKNRAVHLSDADDIPVPQVKEFIESALTYHLRK